jgi:mono/diheme cytochrome c family protein
MSRFLKWSLCIVLWTVTGVLSAAINPAKIPPAATKRIEFGQDVQPIFAKHCYSCHGPDKQKNDFRLDVKEKALAGGESGVALIPGKSAESPLIHFVAGLVPDKVMPQKGERLTAEQIGVLRAWIDQGADWPAQFSSRTDVKDYWAFKPLVRDGRELSIDHFVLAKLKEKGLSLSRPADKATLLRRATFDLIGLPPTPKELEDFLADSSNNAFAKVVNRLLASPHYGERWARHWLDLARFSESDGFEFDKMREQAWHYRDYLVRSFNEDKPYAQFIREQIAGDALEPMTRDAIIATGFLTAGPYDEAGNTSASVLLKARIREEEMEDMIAGVSQTFFAMTVNCARCHDHKFDPIPQRDYYRIKAALDGVRHGNRSLLTAAEAKAGEVKLNELNAKVQDVDKQVAALEQNVSARILRERASTSSDTDASTNVVQPLARWKFEGNARDSVGKLHGSLMGGAKILNGRLVLDGKEAFLRTESLTRDIREKTLEAWVVFSNRTQRGGGVISLENKSNGTFDAIVYGERVPKKWMAGSSYYQRSRDLTAPDEEAGPSELLHVAMVYRADNSISVYRNGQSYGETYTPKGEQADLQTYASGNARVLLGLRHTGAGNGFFAGEIEEARLYDRALSSTEIADSARSMNSKLITREQLVNAMTSEEKNQHQALIAEAEKWRTARRAIPPVPEVYAAVSRQPEPTFVLARGDVEKKRAEVTAGSLSALARADFALSAATTEAQRRLKLADWIASPDNPLTWRVMVNRVWHHHFGRGLVGTPNDFGVNGERPSHPELLDALATEFLTQDGSLKKLHRAIMLSATYQQSSSGTLPEDDADNRLLSRFPLRRLEAEAVRDAMLSVSGQLNRQMGGPGFRPFKVTVSGSHFYEITDPTGAEFNRRTIYRMNIQSGKDPLLDSLDCPDPSTKTPARNTTTTPIQSLGLMNNAFVQRQCRYFAARLEREAGAKRESQIELSYRLTFGRGPRPDELKSSIELAQAHGLESVCWVLLNASEFLYVR